MRKNKYNIVHLTSVHPRYDTRIFIKMCKSLATRYSVALVVADGKGDEINSDVSIYDVGKNSGGRVSRMTKTVRNVYRKAKELNGEIYHMHDPELIPIGLRLKKLGKKVIFDAHEDLPKQLKGKPYLSRLAKFFLPKIIGFCEKYACQRLDVIVAATPSIKDKFIENCCRSIDINNYPILNEFVSNDRKKLKSTDVAYIGVMSEIRGICELVHAMHYTNGIKLNLVGEYSNVAFQNRVEKVLGFCKVTEYGYLSRAEVKNVLSNSCAGIVTFLSSPNHVDAQPNKMFEYMSASLPIITSNFPFWRQIVEGNKCGICVDSEDSKEIGRAIQYLADNPDDAERLGQNGRKAIEDKYNWGKEVQKLFVLYEELLE